MNDEYKRSMKNGILDYVLLDPKEQRRLGLHMPEPVCSDTVTELFTKFVSAKLRFNF